MYLSVDWIMYVCTSCIIKETERVENLHVDSCWTLLLQLVNVDLRHL